MAVVRMIIDDSSARRRLGKLVSGLKPGSPEANGCLRVMGLAGLEFERKEFIEHSKPGDAFWAKLGFATLMLRRHGGAKVADAAGVESLRERTKKLRDQNHLLDSLFEHGSNNVMRTQGLSISVGTADSRAALLDKGGMTGPFVFDREKRRIFDQNVSKTLGGARKPRATKDGSRRKWKARGLKSPWNPFYFMWLNVFKRWDKTGRQGVVPARPIIVPADANLIDRLRRTALRFLGDLGKG